MVLGMQLYHTGRRLHSPMRLSAGGTGVAGNGSWRDAGRYSTVTDLAKLRG